MNGDFNVITQSTHERAAISQKNQNIMKISSHNTIKADAEEWRRLPPVHASMTSNDLAKETGTNKDNLVSHDLAQKTYARLNDVYAQRLCDNWTEDAEPAKHVFEDLAIAAYVIELWRSLYHISPKSEGPDSSRSKFPGFVDMACGNGVLVYVLLMEGYTGLGIDAQRRKSWKTFPEFIQDRLIERVLIPKPFIDAIGCDNNGSNNKLGDYPEGTFIISNHADELTVWTPLMAALAHPAAPLPFLAIPCCSHSLSGDRYRYLPPQKENISQGLKENEPGSQNNSTIDQHAQPASGDLKALRLLKQKEKTEEGISESMYGSLAAKTMETAKVIGYEVQRHQLQIPSTRNIGIIGSQSASNSKNKDFELDIMGIVQRECEMDGGIEVAAKKWVARVQHLQTGISEDVKMH